MRPGRGKLTDKHRVSPERLMRQNEPGGIVPLTAQTQQICVEAMREIQFATNRMVERLRVGHLKELRGGTELLPELSRVVKRLAGLRCRVAFNGLQDGAQRSAKFELLTLMSEI